MLYAALWSVTIVVCSTMVVAYFVVKGLGLPRVPVRVIGDWPIEGDDEIGFVAIRNGSSERHELNTNLRYRLFTDRLRARVNARGEQTPERVDVVAIGCSFTWGHGIENDATYPQQMARLARVSVANFGMGSYGTVQSLQMLKRTIALKPKVVVYGFIEDHLRRNVSPCAPSYAPYCVPVSYLVREGQSVAIRRPHFEYFSPEENRSYHTEILMREPKGLVNWALGAKWAAKIALFKYQNSSTISVDSNPETAAAGLAAMIEAILDETKAIGAKLIVLNIPYLTRESSRSAPEPLIAAVSGKDLTFVDLGPSVGRYYEQHANGTLTLSVADSHPNPEANRLIAEALLPSVMLALVEARGR